MPPLINIGQGEGRAEYSMALQDTDTAGPCMKWTPKLLGEAEFASAIDECRISDLRLNKRPRLNVQIDRNRAMALGVTPDAISNTLYDAYGNRRISTIQSSLDEYDVIWKWSRSSSATPPPRRSFTSRQAPADWSLCPL